MLKRVARGRRGVFSLSKSTHNARKILNMLFDLEILKLEKTPQNPPVRIKGQKLKREIRRYKIQDKVHFNKGFYRFWFSFCAGNALFNADINARKKLLELIGQNLEHFYSLSFELACAKLLAKSIGISQNAISSYWQKGVEIDIFANTRSKLIVGEVKYKEHKVCKSLLTKLQFKCEQCGLKPDYYALFSLGGFSSELKTHLGQNVWLFSLNDFKVFL